MSTEMKSSAVRSAIEAECMGLDGRLGMRIRSANDWRPVDAGFPKIPKSRALPLGWGVGLPEMTGNHLLIEKQLFAAKSGANSASGKPSPNRGSSETDR